MNVYNGIFISKYVIIIINFIRQLNIFEQTSKQVQSNFLVVNNRSENFIWKL